MFTFVYVCGYRLVRIHKRLQKAVSCLEFFTTHEWNFKNTNVQKLFTELDPNDQKTFYFDVSQLEWRSYIESYIWGTRRFVLKDDPSTVPSAKLQLKRWVPSRAYEHSAQHNVWCSLMIVKTAMTKYSVHV